MVSQKLSKLIEYQIGKSVIARAKNGTGKTGAFVIPTLEKIDTTKNAIQGTEPFI